MSAELLKSLLKVGPLSLLGFVVVLEKVAELVLEEVDALRIQGEAADTIKDGGFNVGNRQRAERAPHVHPASADVVVVVATVSLAPGEDKSASVSPLVALLARQQPTQIVGVYAVSLRPPRPELQNRLNLEEGLRGNERFMVARVEIALVSDVSGIVRITQNHRQLTVGDDLLGPLVGRPSCETLLFQLIVQASDRVVSACVGFEGPADEGCAYWVDVNGVDEVAVNVLSDIEVANPGPTDRATALDLVQHLYADVLPALPDLQFVEDVSDALHRFCVVSFAEVLIDGGQLHIQYFEHAGGEGGVYTITEGSRPGVDEDLFDFGMVSQEVEQFFEDRPILDGLCRLARLDKLLDDRDSKALGEFTRGSALRGDTVAVSVDIESSPHLPCGGYAQV